MNFAQFCADPALIGEPISAPWAALYKAFDGEPLDETELALWRQMTGRQHYEQRDRRELFAVKGRRAQGTRTACKYLIFKIATGDFERFAPPGERLHCPLIFQSRDVAREGMSYFVRFYTASSILSREVEDIAKERITLRNFVISVWTCSFRAPRGIAAPIALCDEVGVWRQEGSDVDREVLRSLRPAMIQFPNRKLVVLGTPWVKAGVLYETWEADRAESA